GRAQRPPAGALPRWTFARTRGSGADHVSSRLSRPRLGPLATTIQSRILGAVPAVQEGRTFRAGGRDGRSLRSRAGPVRADGRVRARPRETAVPGAVP